VKKTFDIRRRLNIRPRRSDRSLFWYAVAAALSAHVLFWGAFSHRRITAVPRESSAAVTMLTREELAGISDWLKYHDPADFNRGDFRKAVTAQSFREVEAGFAPRRPLTEVRVRNYSVGKYRELPVTELSPRAVPPVSVPEPPPVKAKPRPGGITDGRGNALRIDDLKLPPRTPSAVGDTVLRVLNPGRYPTLTLESSCGDAELDRFAQRVLLPLANADRAPDFLIVSWPDPEPEVRK
jgi:hypothetical protein